MPLLASICRTASAPPAILAWVDPRSGRIAFPPVDGLPADATLMGMARRGPDILLLYERNRLAHGGAGGLAVLGPDLRTKWAAALETVRLPHSIAVCGERVFCVSSFTDSIVELVLGDGRVTGETVVWQAEPLARGRHHVNALCRWRDRWVVSMFGEAAADPDGRGGHGAVLDVTGGGWLCRGLHQPHSVGVTAAGRLIVLDSLTGRVIDLSGDAPRPWFAVAGYARGWAEADGLSHVATSMFRTRSRTTGEPRPELLEQSPCGIFSVDGGGTPKGFVDLSAVAAELYDLLPFDGGPGSASITRPTASVSSGASVAIGGFRRP